VKVKKKQYPKLSDRGVTCMFVGYAVNHDGDWYEMLDVNNGTVYVTRDVIWLKRMFFTQPPSADQEEGVYLPIYLPTDVKVREREPLATKDNDEEETVNTPDDEEDEDEDEKQAEGIEGEEGEATATTRSGRSVKAPSYLNEYELGNLQHGFKLTKAEERFYSQMKELGELALCAPNLPCTEEINEVGLVGAGIGGGFKHTGELKVMKYKEAMNSLDKTKWEQGVETEHEKMKTYQVFKPVDVEEVPQDAKILTSTWVMRKKADGTCRARLTARGYAQIDGLHFDSTDTSAPVVNDTTIRIVFVLMIMAGWTAMLLDVRGAFMNGRFKDDEKLYMHIPEGFEKWYPNNVVLLLTKTLYGLKQAAMQFWKEMKKALEYMNYERSKADPCLNFKWVDNKLQLWITWVDDCLVIGPKDNVTRSKEQMKKLFDCDDIGEMREYAGKKDGSN
jgi:hypothetical protein